MKPNMYHQLYEDYKIVDHTSKTSKIVKMFWKSMLIILKLCCILVMKNTYLVQLNTSGIDADVLPQGKIGYCSLFLTKSWDSFKRL